MINEDLDRLDIDKLNKDLLDGIEDYIDVSKSNNTRKAYEKDWRDFVRFCKYTKSKYLPADYPTVSKYLVYCAKIQKLKVSTIERRLASIIFKHTSNPIRSANIKGPMGCAIPSCIISSIASLVPTPSIRQ